MCWAEPDHKSYLTKGGGNKGRDAHGETRAKIARNDGVATATLEAKAPTLNVAAANGKSKAPN
ncbi:MAG TPA: hypothetical protein VJN69_10875 [Candidatus Acidoferrales bacterium]|nr:hypothetical protein [Candidatus Acidoferrales bacterium]